MKNSFIGLTVLLTIFLVGCSDNSITENVEIDDVSAEEVSAEEEEVLEEAIEGESVKTEEPIEEEPVAEEVVNAFFEAYETSTVGYQESKPIALNTYQTYIEGVPQDTYITWKFTPGNAEPEKVYEVAMANRGPDTGPSKQLDTARTFAIHEGFYVIEPISSLNEETVTAIKSGYFPFSDLRLDMTKEEASMVHHDYYDYYEDYNATYYYGTEVTYSLDDDTGLLNSMEVRAEVFSDNRTLDDIIALFGQPINEAGEKGAFITSYDFALGDYKIRVNVNYLDEEWATMKITKNE